MSKVRTTPPPTLIDFPEAAQMLAISTRHLRRLVDAGRTPRPIRLGGSVRFNAAALTQWIEAGCPDMRRMH
jgi:excisionase family DNA binding protein